MTSPFDDVKKGERFWREIFCVLILDILVYSFCVLDLEIFCDWTCISVMLLCYFLVDMYFSSMCIFCLMSCMNTCSLSSVMT